MRFHLCIHIAALLILAGRAGVPAYAQSEEIAFERVLSGMVTDIVQDEVGYLWVATLNGLFRYDGYETRAFVPELGDSTSLSDPRVTSLLVDRSGMLWVGTFNGGLNRFDAATGSFTRYRHVPGAEESLSDDRVLDLIEDRDGVIWIGTANGVNRFAPDSLRFTHYTHDPDDPTSLSDSTARVLYEDERGTLWIGTGAAHDPFFDSPMEGGLNRFEPATESFTRFLPDPGDPERLIDGRIRALHEDSRGNFWVGTLGDGLHSLDRQTGTFTRYRFDPDDRSRLSRPHRLGEETWESGVSFIHEDRSGSLWIGAMDGGVHRYDPDTGDLTHIHHRPDEPGSLSDNRVVTIHESRDGSLWIGTESGVHKLLQPPVRLPVVRLPGENGSVFSLLEDQTGRVWIGTESGGLYRYDPASGAFENFRNDPDDSTSLGPGTVSSLLQDNTGNIWIGLHGGGLNRFVPESETFVRYAHDPADPGSLSGDRVQDVYEDRSGHLWVGTGQNGLNRFDPRTGTFARYGHEPNSPTSLSTDAVFDVHEDQAGRLWVATFRGGLNLFDPDTETFSMYRHDPNDPASVISDIVLDVTDAPDGGLWVGTFKGLDLLNPETGTFTHITPSNSVIPTQAIKGVLVDDRGDLWMASRLHPAVMRLDPRERTVRRYEEQASTHRPAGFEDALYRSEAGKLYIGRENEFYAFRPEDVDRQVNAYPPEIALRFQLRDRDETVFETLPGRGQASGAQTFSLTHDENAFSFEFTGLHYVDPEENRYLYRLEGYDEDWHGPGSQRSVSYYQVPPGDYVFRVKAANRDGVWTEKPASLAVSVLPPWWRMWWAYGLYVFLLGFGLLLAYRFQRRRLLRHERDRARRRELEREKEHTRELEAMNEQLRSHEAELADQNKRLEQLDTQKSRFFANISHEFRTPLTLILGPLDDALSAGKQLGEHQIRLIRRNARRLLGLINQLLDLSKLEAGGLSLDLRRGDLARFLRALTLSFTGLAEREEIALSFSARPEEIPSIFDPDKLEKVLTNLVSNAVTFTPSGGKISVTVRGQDNEAEIRVRDTGPGIPEEELPRIFDQFYQVDGSIRRRHGGTGIGLALVKELVELHGGTIEVESEVGFGTSFLIVLSLEMEAEESDMEPITVPESPRFGPTGEGMVREAEPADWARSPDEEGLEEEATSPPEVVPTILVVEDHPDMRAYLISHLEERYRTLEAADGEEGLERARSSEPDLILSDVMMPKMDGYELCREIKCDPDLAEVPVVLLTAKADLESRIEGLETGADDYLAKPFSAEEVLTRMENLIEIRRHLRERYADTVRLGPDQVEVPSQEAAFLERVRTVAEANLGNANFGVSDLAAEVGISQRQLLRRMREAVDMSPAAYLRMMRLERAAQLLEQDAGLVSEIAYEVGFKNAGYFSRVFKQVFGTSPSEYRP